MTNATKIGRALAVFEKGDFLPILTLVVAVQGTVLISQSAAALLLDTAAIGRIRVFESMISHRGTRRGFWSTSPRHSRNGFTR